MLFNKYLEELLGSRVKIKALRILFRFETKTFTSRELAGSIGVSHTAVLKSLGHLQGMGIITVEKHGTSNLISLNKESALYNNLKQLFESEKQTLQCLIEIIKKAPFKAKSVVLFGSIPEGREEISSDIDLLVITDDKEKAYELIGKLQEQFSRLFGNTLMPYILSENEFNQKKQTDFVKGILENHILVKGDKL